MYALWPNSFSSHKLYLKENCIVYMIRNLNPAQELVNGTRLLVLKMNTNSIICQILAISFVFFRLTFFWQIIHNIWLKWNDINCQLFFDQQLRCINVKDKRFTGAVGISLITPVFTHRQLYTVFSRATIASNIYVQLPSYDDDPRRKYVTTNCVYPKILE